jgi:hypothetical protein
MRFIHLLLGAMVLQLVGFSTANAASGCNADPCIFQEAPPRVVIREIVKVQKVYVDVGEKPHERKITKTKKRKPSTHHYASRPFQKRPVRIPLPRSRPVVLDDEQFGQVTEQECEFIPFSKGHAAQPIVFFRYKEDAHCQVRKIFCVKCTDWIQGRRGTVAGPASGMLGGRSAAYAVPPEQGGVWVPVQNKGHIAYCDQAQGSTWYSWLVKR